MCVGSSGHIFIEKGVMQVEKVSTQIIVTYPMPKMFAIQDDAF